MPWLIWIYRVLFLPVFLVLLPYCLVRMIRRGGYLRGLWQRVGFGPKLPPATSPRIWIQAVSVGEILAIESLVNRLLEKQFEVALTTTTSTGYKLALEKYGGRVQFTGLFPLDFLPFAHLAWGRIRPDLAILMESELWPEHLYQARCRRVPVLLVNARMSDRSFNRAKGVTWAYRQILQSLAGLAASGQLDLERYLELGIPEKQATYTGNLKLDIDPGPELTDVAKKTLLEEIGFEENLPVILGSSTWPGEEAALLNAFQQLLDEGVDCRLLLVPRHAERRNEVRKILEGQQHPWHFRTDYPSPKNTVKIYVADTTGELRNFTQLATVAFIGKTLPPNEGSQTPIEAAAFGVPSLFGPATSNFRIICSQLEETGASIQITDAKALLPNLRKLLRNPGKLQKMSNAARSWHQTNLGATQRTLDFLSTHLPA